MRIHFVSEHASPLALLGGVDAGGQNVHVAALARQLAALGADVVVHTRRDDPALPRTVEFCPGVIVDHVDAGPPVPIPKDELLPHMGAFADDLERQWRRARPDVVHAHFWMSGLAATEAGNRTGIPVALTYHALGVDKRRHQGTADTSPPCRIEVERWLATVVDRVIATTARERRKLVDLGADPRRIEVVPCGVDLDQFEPDRMVVDDPEDRADQAIAASAPPSDDRRRVVCVTRLVPRKGLATVIDAIAGLPDVELLIAGGPPAAMLPDDPYARALTAMIEGLDLGDRAQLLGGIDRASVPALLRSASVVCCTPWYEPFGLVAVEAMACGVPVVASAVGGLAETVVDGETGLLVPPRDHAALRRALGALLNDPVRTATMRAAALRRVGRYGWTAVANQTRDILSGLAATGRRRVAPPPPLADARWAADAVSGGGS